MDHRDVALELCEARKRAVAVADETVERYAEPRVLDAAVSREVPRRREAAAAALNRTWERLFACVARDVVLDREAAAEGLAAALDWAGKRSQTYRSVRRIGVDTARRYISPSGLDSNSNLLAHGLRHGFAACVWACRRDCRVEPELPIDYPFQRLVYRYERVDR
jgi:hypothetical protein